MMTLAGKKNHNLNFPLRMNGCYRDGYGFLLKKNKIKLPVILYVGDIINEGFN